MAKDSSFDIVSEFDRQELVNAIDQTKRDVSTRFDLKDSNTEIELGEKSITITSSDDLKVRNVIDILEDKISKRGLSPFILDREANVPEAALGGRMRQELPLKEGIEKDLAKKIVAEIKSLKLKVQASIQGEQVRVSGKVRDDLQAVIQLMKDKSAEWSVPLQYQNYR